MNTISNQVVDLLFCSVVSHFVICIRPLTLSWGIVVITYIA